MLNIREQGVTGIIDSDDDALPHCHAVSPCSKHHVVNSTRRTDLTGCLCRSVHNPSAWNSSGKDDRSLITGVVAIDEPVTETG